MSDAAAPRSRGRDSDSTGPVRTVTTDEGRTVAYAEYGTPDGAPVLFLHGTPGARVLGELFDEAARSASRGAVRTCSRSQRRGRTSSTP